MARSAFARGRRRPATQDEARQGATWVHTGHYRGRLPTHPDRSRLGEIDGTGAGEQLRGQLKAIPERRTQIPNLELTAFLHLDQKEPLRRPESITMLTEWSGSSLAQGEWGCHRKRSVTFAM